MQQALPEPHIIVDAVFAQIPLQGGNIQGQGVVHQGLPALLLGGIYILIPVQLRKLPCVIQNVHALIAVLGQGVLFLPLKQLHIPHRKGRPELVDLVTGIVHVKFAGHIVAAPFQRSRQTVPDGAAAGIAHVHGAGGVGGNIFHHHLFVLAVVAAAVAGALFQRLRRQSAKPRLLHVKIDEAGAGHLAALHRQLPEIKAFQQRSRYFLRGTAHGTGIHHGGIGGKVAVFGVGGDLHHIGGGFGSGQQPLGSRRGKGRPDHTVQPPAGLIKAGNHSQNSPCCISNLVLY